jgi:hypothetical protein
LKAPSRRGVDIDGKAAVGKAANRRCVLIYVYPYAASVVNEYFPARLRVNGQAERPPPVKNSLRLGDEPSPLPFWPKLPQDHPRESAGYGNARLRVLLIQERRDAAEEPDSPGTTGGEDRLNEVDELGLSERFLARVQSKS